MLGGKDLTDQSRGSDKVIKVIFTPRTYLPIAHHFGIRKIELHLFINREGASYISVFLVKNSSVEVGIYLIHLAARIGRFELGKICVQLTFFNDHRAIANRAVVACKHCKATLDVINRSNCAGNKCVEFES